VVRWCDGGLGWLGLAWAKLPVSAYAIQLDGCTQRWYQAFCCWLELCLALMPPCLCPCSASHVPRPGYLTRLAQSARPSLAATTTAASEVQQPVDPAVRRLQTVNRSLDSLDTHARR